MISMKQILCFGDSNTYGLIPATKDRYDWNTRWTGILSKKIEKNGYRVVEEGLCGRTTIFEDATRKGRKGADLLPIILETHKPIDTVVLMLGTNDCKTAYGATAEKIGSGIELLIKQIKDSDPDINIILVSPIELGEGVSGYKDFAGTYGKMPCEFYGMEKLNGRWEDEKSTALLVGSYVDSYFEGSLEQFKKENPEIFTQKGELKANFKQAEEIIARIERSL